VPETKITPKTLHQWLDAARGTLRAVKINTSMPGRAHGLVPHTRGGLRVEGLDLAGVITALRTLETRTIGTTRQMVVLGPVLEFLCFWLHGRLADDLNGPKRGQLGHRGCLSGRC
jgi:hypothetical protein